MYISPIYNKSLLCVIIKDKELTYEELRKKYLPPEQPGIICGETVMFDSDLKTLEEMGLIIREGNIIRYNEQ